MQATPETIRGSVDPRLLKKADRLFLNSNTSIWTELLQNSRRAGATLIDVSIEDGGENSSIVTMHDNGHGVDDFRKLLTLGQSGWDEATQQREDPAGMGLFALCRSEVEVHSGNRRMKISPPVFLGESDTCVEPTSERLEGTRIRFTRSSTKESLAIALHEVTRFCPVEVRLEGVPLERRGFLEGALYREVIDGIEIGFFPNFSAENWNFYGLCLREIFLRIDGLLGQSRDGEPLELNARFNVLETSQVKLQLPDRRGIIQDEFLIAFMRKARAAAYRFFKTQSRHALSYRNWKEAKDLGVDLPEAAFLLVTWHAANPGEDQVEPLFGAPVRHLLPDVSDVILADPNLPNAHTLEAALESGATIAGRCYAIEPAFEGYSWYDHLPLITDASVLIDGTPYENWEAGGGGRPTTIELEVTAQQALHGDRKYRIPALIHVVPDEWSSYDGDFVAVSNSPWDNDELNGPFSVSDFLVWALFEYWDEGDTWSTQMSDFGEEMIKRVNNYFRSPRANLLAALRSLCGRNVTSVADTLGIGEIRILKGPDREAAWSIELIEAAIESELPEPPLAVS